MNEYQNNYFIQIQKFLIFIFILINQLKLKILINSMLLIFNHYYLNNLRYSI